MSLDQEPATKKLRSEEKSDKEKTTLGLPTVLVSSSDIQHEVCSHLNLAEIIRLSTVTKPVYNSMNNNPLLWKEMDFYTEQGGKQISNRELHSLLERTGCCVEHLSLRGNETLTGDCGLKPLTNCATKLKFVDLRIRNHDVSNGPASADFDVAAVIEVLQTAPLLENVKFRWRGDLLMAYERKLSAVYEEPILSFVAGIQMKSHAKYIGKKCCDKDCGKTIESIPEFHMMELMACTDCKGAICPGCFLRHCRGCGKTSCYDCKKSAFRFCGAAPVL